VRGGGENRKPCLGRLQPFCEAAPAPALSAVAFAVACFAAPAWADCQPAAPASGQTVNCTGTDPDGFAAGAGVNNLAVNVASGATVQSNAVPIAIGLNSSNTVINNGTLSGFVGKTGIDALDSNTITNNSAITINSGGFGINVRNGNIIGNNGTIAFGADSIGISGNNGNNVANAGTITMGRNGPGILLADSNTVANSGAITVSFAGTGIFVRNGNTVTSSGTVSGTDNTGAVRGASFNSLANSGAISLGVGSVGMLVTGVSNTATNSGSIAVGDRGAGLYSSGPAGSHNALINDGTITAAASAIVGVPAAGIVAERDTAVTNNKTIVAGDNSAGIITVFGGNTVVNNGTLSVGAAAIGINTRADSIITNNGTVVAGANGVSIGRCLCQPAINNTVVNNGTLDGVLNLAGSGNSFANKGTLTISNTGTAVGATHLVSGDFTQTASGTLALRVTSAGAHDALTVSGTATPGGKLLAVVQPGMYATTTTYLNVLTAGNPITSQFAQVASSMVFLRASATYHANSIDLTLTRVGFELPGETQNQRAVAGALQRAFSPDLTGNAAALYANLTVATSAAVLDRLSGEGTSATQNAAFSAGDMFMATLNDQLWLWRSGDRAGIADAGAAALGYAAGTRIHPAFKAIPLAAPAFLPSWHGWAAGFGGAQSFNGDAVVGSANASNNSAGGALGVDYAANPDLLLGFGVGGSASNFSVPDRATTGTVDGGHIGAYSMQRWGAAYATALVSYSRFDNSTSRSIAGVGPTELARGSFASDRFGARFEIGRSWTYGQFAVTPFAAIQVAELRQRGFSESSFVAGAGPGILGLSYTPVDVTSLPAFLGAQFDARMAFDNGVVWSPFVRAAWVHEFEPARGITASFLSVPGASFAVDGPRSASDAVKLDLGSRLMLNHRAALTATFTGEFSDRTRSYAGRAGLRMEF
jgi:uncharacterized protein with beta-barrel porin domain